jgi:uncharacterized protein
MGWNTSAHCRHRGKEIVIDPAQRLTEGDTRMDGSLLRFYVHEDHRHQGRMVWEWLLEQANKLGIRGGSAFKAMAGFGRHHHLHEAKFFELAGSLAIEVEFIVTGGEADKLLDMVRAEKIRIFYACIPAHFGIINPDREDPRSVKE